MKKNFTCINCPLGCSVDVTLNDKGEILDITGNTCPLGEKYVRNEIKDPRRMVTSTVRLIGSEHYSVPVKTRDAIPKNKIFECMKEINQIQVTAPVKVGDVVKENIAGTDIDLVATANRLN
ncbi:MAG: DUF1667 domain-containing protein [Peptoniphilaceae bacterium]|nr:DUF1667 domain-containing protein [Peptoniphilaceae bacterium]MDY6018954.1 DUF1667 domain-containing protein [Anaerococcus sp.]